MTSMRNDLNHYGFVSIFLHWLTAILVIGLLIVGLYMTGLPLSPQKIKIYGWHKAFGILVLALTLVRLIARKLQTAPSLIKIVPSLWQRLAAYATHTALYILLLLMPLTGWLQSSAAGIPVSFFGWFILPDLISPNQEARHFFHESHEILAYALIGCVCLHIVASFWHHWVQKDDVLRRMLP